MTQREWKPLNTAPFFKNVEVGGWKETGVSNLEWWNGVSKRGLFGWNFNKYSWTTHWRDLPETPEDRP